MDKTAELPRDEAAAAIKPADKPKPETVKPKEAKPKKFTKGRLRDECRALFNVSESVFDGAMYGHETDMTVDDAKGIIGKWLEAKVKGNGG